MQFLYRYIKKYWQQFFIAVVFVTLETLCDLLQPTIMSQIIDVGVAGRQMDYILRMGGLMLFVTAVGALAASSRNIISSTVSQNFGTELRADLYRKIQSLSFANMDKLDRASLVTRLTNDVTQVQLLVNGLMRIFLKAPLLCIGGLIMAIHLNSRLAVVLAVVVPVVGVLIAINIKIGFPLFIKVQNALDQVNSVMREYLSGIRVVRAFNRFDYEVAKFEKTNKEYQSRSVTAMRVLAAFSPSVALTVNFGIVAVLWLGGLGVNSGQIQVGHIIAFTNYMTQILFALMIIFLVFNMFVRARASAGRIGEVFLQDNGMKWEMDVEPDNGLTGRIDFENVFFTYEGAASDAVIKNINLTCMPGETVGIIGSTGAGKSSLVGLIPRFYDVTAGSVKVNGEDVKNINPRRLREKIAVVPQKTLLFTGTISDNLRWGKEDASQQEIEAAAKIAAAHNFIMAFPEGYQTRLGQGGVNLSGGQKQRISIARALVRKPAILIMDDCTSAVDVVTETKIRESLKKYVDNLTCLIIAQRITSVMDADKIVVLDNGEIIGIGTHEELMKSCAVYQEIFQSQMGKETQTYVSAK
ncbi:MAG TPA: ABC transporter ATP-binding protein [Methylomusa anaerophila]|uniref:Putative ABC transporter ATP-binding protein n=1 Tax=Methylomusa anaerophila TaxID=1930071 RepID=A0A348AIE6_9FIRM|nr:ABC transporter ATP-binding protein [Methylomusa anaerophila]BBB90844.1 putative ABC transporter ATP-binding protein [Methylomusa anaerophila]HML90638.1 ABC transporter ATP-binding protein [Methylomusa anaerophila]